MSTEELNALLAQLDVNLAKDLATLKLHYQEDKALLQDVIARLDK